MEKTRREFLSLELPDAVKQGIADLTSGIPGLHSHPQDNFHITLKFLGDVTESQQESVQKLMAFLAGNFGPVDVQFSGFKAEEGRLRLLVASPEKLSEINMAIEYNLPRIGITQQDRIAYEPHVTLGRYDGAGLPSVNFDFSQLRFTGDEVALLETVRGEKTARFDVLAYTKLSKI